MVYELSQKTLVTSIFGIHFDTVCFTSYRTSSNGSLLFDPDTSYQLDSCILSQLTTRTAFAFNIGISRLTYDGNQTDRWFKRIFLSSGDRYSFIFSFCRICGQPADQSFCTFKIFSSCKSALAKCPKKTFK